MKAIAINQLTKKLYLTDIDEPTIKEDELLVKTLETGICSTDRELLTYQKIIPPEGYDFLIIGHEAKGKVMEVGSSVSQFQEGDVVVPTVRRGCGDCPLCNLGKSDMCKTGNYKERGILGLHGFMSEYFTEKEINLIKVPKAIKRHAVLLEPLSIGVKAFDQCSLLQKSRLYTNSDMPEKEIFKNVLVIGAGPIGLLMSLVMANHEVNLTCIDIEEEGGIKSDIIKMMGGQYINLKEYLEGNRINLNRLRSNVTIEGFDLIVDASRDSLTCFQLIDLLKHNGIIILLGLPYKNEEYTFNLGHFIFPLVLKNQVVLGSVNSNKTHFETGIKYLEQSQEKFNNLLDKIVTHRLHFTDYQEAFNIESAGRIKVVLNW